MKTFRQFINESKVDPKDLEKWVDGFRDTIDDSTICEWIKGLDPTESKVIDDFLNPDDIISRYGEINFQGYLQAEKTENEISNIEDKIDELKERKNKLEIKLDNDGIWADEEMMYYFQKEMIEKDWNWFYETFIEHELSNLKDSQTNDPNADLTIKPEFYDVHPRILEEYRDEIEMRLDTKKYNL